MVNNFQNSLKKALFVNKALKYNLIGKWLNDYRIFHWNSEKSTKKVMHNKGAKVKQTHFTLKGKIV